MLRKLLIKSQRQHAGAHLRFFLSSVALASSPVSIASALSLPCVFGLGGGVHAWNVSKRSIHHSRGVLQGKKREGTEKEERERERCLQQT